MNDTTLQAECSEKIRADVQQIKLTAARGTPLFDRLWDRDQELDQAISPVNSDDPLIPYARLKCGCRWIADGFNGGYPINPVWVEECDDHSGEPSRGGE